MNAVSPGLRQRSKTPLAASGYDCAYAPEDLSAIYAAYDAAWALIEGQFVSAIARDSARYRLATIILSVAKMQIADIESINAIALAALNRRPN